VDFHIDNARIKLGAATRVEEINQRTAEKGRKASVAYLNTYEKAVVWVADTAKPERVRTFKVAALLPEAFRKPPRRAGELKN
jgi:hypothetical protein